MVSLTDALYRATESLVEEDLGAMVLSLEDLPDGLRGFELAREGLLDNEDMASQGFPGSTTGEVRSAGRITGYLREFATPLDPSSLRAGADLITATVVHLFHKGHQVSDWMSNKFLGEFQHFAGKELGGGQRLIRADQVDYDGFSDEAVGLRTLQTTYSGMVSSDVVDFRIGRLLGVAYVVTLGEGKRDGLVGQLGIALEKKMVGVLLGAGRQ